MIYMCLAEDAKEYGTDTAIILWNLCYWIAHNKRNKKNIQDGRCWTYNSYEAFSMQFNHLTPSQIRSCIKKLYDKKVILKGNFNSNKWDKTLWYALVDESILYKYTSGANSHIDDTNSAHRQDEKNKSTIQKKQIDDTKKTDDITDIIQDIIPNRITDNKKGKSMATPDSISIKKSMLESVIDVIDDFENLKSIKETWIGFAQNRKAMKKPLTIMASQLLLKKLAQQPNRAKTALETMIERNWLGFDWEWLESSVSAPYKNKYGSRDENDVNDSSLWGDDGNLEGYKLRLEKQTGKKSEW